MPDLPPVTLDPVMVRTAFDYTDLEEAMAHTDQVIRETRASLARLTALPPTGVFHSESSRADRDDVVA